MDIAQLKEYYHKWYTPDAMTLIVVGNVDSRSVAEQINKTFGGLKGSAKRRWRFLRYRRCRRRRSAS